MFLVILNTCGFVICYRHRPSRRPSDNGPVQFTIAKCVVTDTSLFHQARILGSALGICLGYICLGILGIFLEISGTFWQLKVTLI